MQCSRPKGMMTLDLMNGKANSMVIHDRDTCIALIGLLKLGDTDAKLPYPQSALALSNDQFCCYGSLYTRLPCKREVTHAIDLGGIYHFVCSVHRTDYVRWENEA